MTSDHILIVEDDLLMRRSLGFGLERAGYRVSSAETAEAGLELAQVDPPDLVLLDIGLPAMDGLTALLHFKEHAATPVIFLTARRRDIDEIVGLELGADDYITKPVNLDVLLARVKAMLRRSETAQLAPGRGEKRMVGDLTIDPARGEKRVVGDLTIDPAAHTLLVAGRPVSLSRREFDLMYLFALHPGEVLSNAQLLAGVWGAEFTGQPQVVYVHLRWLRKKIEDDPENPQRLLTVHGVGYKLEPRGEA